MTKQIYPSIWRWECESKLSAVRICYAGGRGDKKFCHRAADDHKKLNPGHKPMVWKEK